MTSWTVPQSSPRRSYAGKNHRKRPKNKPKIHRYDDREGLTPRLRIDRIGGHRSPDGHFQERPAHSKDAVLFYRSPGHLAIVLRSRSLRHDTIQLHQLRRAKVRSGRDVKKGRTSKRGRPLLFFIRSATTGALHSRPGHRLPLLPRQLHLPHSESA